MRIHNPSHSRLPEVVGMDERSNSTKGAQRGRKAEPGVASDRVEVSEAANEIQAAETREEAQQSARIAEIRQLIAEGRYEVEPGDLADSIIREEILPWLHKRR